MTGVIESVRLNPKEIAILQEIQTWSLKINTTASTLIDKEQSNSLMESLSSREFKNMVEEFTRLQQLLDEKIKKFKEEVK